MVQAYEYIHAPFGFKDSIYGATFFMATGFHGFHVLIGTIFLLVCLIRAMKGDFTPKQHFGFEAAAWYWHFVDVVWLFLFASIYVWASAGATDRRTAIEAVAGLRRAKAVAATRPPSSFRRIDRRTLPAMQPTSSCLNGCRMLIVDPLRRQACGARRSISVRVDKSERRMELLGKGMVLRTYSVALGGNPIGHKQREGDERTPEGRYVLDWRNPKSALHQSIHISYPNDEDKARPRKAGVSPGGDIMIHGQPNGYGWWAWVLQMFDWTDGCIAVTDAEMEEIWDMVADGTPIEINP